MDLKNWRENISKVMKTGYSRLVVIPTVIANEMEIEENSYVHMKYDETTKSLVITKEGR